MDENNENPALTPETAPVTTPPPAAADEKTFGAWLKAQRTSQKISLEEIAAVTKVHIMQLKALEDDEISKLPAPAFVRGFLVSYARHLHIDENEVLDRFKTAFGGSLTPLADLLMPSTSKAARSASAPKVAMVSSPHLKQAPSTREVDKSSGPSLSVKSISIIVGIVLFVGLVGSLIALGKRDRAHKAAVSQSETIPIIENKISTESPKDTSSALTHAATLTPQKTETSTAQSSTSASPTLNSAATNSAIETAKPMASNSTVPTTAQSKSSPIAATAPSETSSAPKKYQLEIRAIEGNYVHLRIDDDAPKGITLKANQSHIVDLGKRAVLTISDAGNIEIRWNGTWYAAPGYRGDLKVITLPDQLATLVPKKDSKAASKPRAKPKAKTEATVTAAPTEATPPPTAAAPETTPPATSRDAEQE